MKKIFIILSVLMLIMGGYMQAQQPRFTEFRTEEEYQNKEWDNKITDEKELTDYIIQLVSSRDPADNSNLWVCVQVLDKTTRQLVQELDLQGGYGAGDSFNIGDYNFDGYEDFSLWGYYCSSNNSYSDYFLFDLETKTFFASEFYGTNLEFDSDTKTITSHNRCCTGMGEMYATYQLVGNKMVLIKQHCFHVVIDKKTDDFLRDEDGAVIFEEIDCDTME